MIMAGLDQIPWLQSTIVAATLPKLVLIEFGTDNSQIPDHAVPITIILILTILIANQSGTWSRLSLIQIALITIIGACVTPVYKNCLGA